MGDSIVLKGQAIKRGYPKEAPSIIDVDIHFGGLIDTLQRNKGATKFLDRKGFGKQRSCVKAPEYGNRFIDYMTRMFPEAVAAAEALSRTPETAITDADRSRLPSFKFDDKLQLEYENDIKNKIGKMAHYHTEGGKNKHRNAWNTYQDPYKKKIFS